MAFAGLRGTGDWGTDERPKNFREYILWANPNGSAPLFAMMARAKKQSTDDPEFAWWEESLGGLRLAINYSTAFSTTDTTLTVVANGLRCAPGDVFLVEKADQVAYDNELILVSSVTSDTVIVVKRGAANTTAKPILDAVYLTRIGSAFEEGTGAPSINAKNPTKKYNYTEIFKTSVGITRTANKTKARTGDGWKNDKKRKAFEHSEGIEMAMLFGRRYEDTSGTKPKRYMGGLRSFLSTNVTVFSTTPTEDTFLDAVYQVFNYSTGGAGDQRIVLAGNGFLNALNKLARNSSSTRINFEGTLKMYGMNLQRWILPQGELGVKTHPLLNLHPRYTNSAFIIDPTGLVYRPLDDTFFKDNTQANDDDSREGYWLTECGLEVQHEETMAYIGNFIV